MKNFVLPVAVLVPAIATFSSLVHASPLSPLVHGTPTQPLIIAQDPSVLAFQTERYSVRIFTRDADLIMNVFDRQNNYLWLRDLDVVATSTPEGYTYATVNSDVPVTVFQSQADADVASVTIDDTTELATQVTVATVPPLTATPLPQPLPQSGEVAACWAFPDTAYIYRQGERLLMDITDRDRDETWLQGVSVTPTSSTEGMNYRYIGESTVEVFTSAYDGSCAIVIDDGEPQFGSQ